MTTRSDHPRPRRRGSVRLMAVASIAMIGVLAGACTAPGQATLRGPWTIKLPGVDGRGPSTTIPVTPLCNAVYTPPGFVITGIIVTVPAIQINLTGVIDVPNVKVTIPAAKIALPAVKVSCLGIGLITVTANVVIPLTVRLKDAHLDLNTGVLTLVDPSVTIDGAGLEFPGLGGLVVPIGLTIPIQNIVVPLN